MEFCFCRRLAYATLHEVSETGIFLRPEKQASSCITETQAGYALSGKVANQSTGSLSNAISCSDITSAWHMSPSLLWLPKIHKLGICVVLKQAEAVG